MLGLVLLSISQYYQVSVVCYQSPHVCVCLDVHEKNLVQLYLTDDDPATLALSKLVCVYSARVRVCVLQQN